MYHLSLAVNSNEQLSHMEMELKTEPYLWQWKWKDSWNLLEVKGLMQDGKALRREFSALAEELHLQDKDRTASVPQS